MTQLEEIYANSIDDAIKIASERKSFYFEQHVSTLFSIIETGLSIHFKVQIWGNLK